MAVLCPSPFWVLWVGHFLESGLGDLSRFSKCGSAVCSQPSRGVAHTEAQHASKPSVQSATIHAVLRLIVAMDLSEDLRPSALFLLSGHGSELIYSRSPFWVCVWQRARPGDSWQRLWVVDAAREQNEDNWPPETLNWDPAPRWFPVLEWASALRVASVTNHDGEVFPQATSWLSSLALSRVWMCSVQWMLNTSGQSHLCHKTWLSTNSIPGTVLGYNAIPGIFHQTPPGYYRRDVVC